MGTTFEDSVFDFDLNFLQHSTNSVTDSRIDKQRKAIIVAKKKTIATDQLIKKYYAKKEQFEQNEVILLAAKEECKQVCLDYKVSLEKCTELEKNVKILENKSQEMEKNFEITKNQLEAMKSHAHQLQMLTKDHETVIESLKIENQLDKNNVKEFEFKVVALKQENKILINDLCLARDIAMGKKKLNKHHKKLLLKYDNVKYKKKEDADSSESSGEEAEFFDSSPVSPLSTSFEVTSTNKNEATVKSNEKQICIKKDTIRITEDHDSDYSNEIVSEDTGRGSSLAFSDGDKCFNSPDYFSNDSPFASDCNKIKEKRIFVDACTSPTTVCESVHIATSPLMFDDIALLSDNNINTPMETDSNGKEYFITDIPLSTEIVTIKEKKKMIDVGTSTTTNLQKVCVSTSPLPFEEVNHRQVTNTGTSPIPVTQNVDNNTYVAKELGNEIPCHEVANESIVNSLSPIDKVQTTSQNLPNQCEFEISEKSHDERNCLESNNSKNLNIENGCDYEIETILSRMRLTTRLISPIPTTPVLLKKDTRTQLKSPLKQISNLTKEHTVCSEAMKLREENKVLQTSMADLTKEVQNIKFMLKKHRILPESPKKQKQIRSDRSRISMLFDDSDEETTIIINENNCNSVQGSIPLNASTNVQLPEQEQEEIVIQNDEVLSTHSSTRNDVYSPDELEVQQSTEIDTLIKSKPVLDTDIPRIESRKTIEENLRIDDEIEANLCNPEDNRKEILSIENKRKKFKSSKLSRLDKFRNKLIPKSKIKRIHAPTLKVRSKHKLKPVANGNKMSAELILNNKSAYEKALKVLTDIKLKKKIEVKDIPKAKEVNAIIHGNNKPQEIESNNNINSKAREGASPKKTNIFEVKQPFVCLSQMNLNDLSHKERERKNSVNLSPKKSEKTVPQINTSPINNCMFSYNLNKDVQGQISPEASPKKPEEAIPYKNASPMKNFMTSNTLKQDVQDKKSPNASPRKSEDTKSNDISPVKNIIITRNRSKMNQDPITHIASPKDVSMSESDKPLDRRTRLKRVASDTSPVECKRILRSHHVRELFNDYEEHNKEINNHLNIEKHKTVQNPQTEKVNQNDNILNTNINLDRTVQQTNIDSSTLNHPKNSILCKMLEKYGKSKVKFVSKKVPDEISNTICKKLEDDIAKIIELPIGEKANSAMNKLVTDIQHSWNLKCFLTGLMKYLKDPARKRELFNKQSTPPAPPMTKSEQVLLFIIRQLEMSLPNTVKMVLTQIEFSLFQLNRTPEFDIIESLSHFYALLCRYFGFKNRLRLFLLDAMYCLQFKVVPLVKQCLDVWMHILPLAHMGIAKSPLVTSLVYLLHFYKCEDRFNRIQDIRFILNKKYFYQITDWNETKILEMFRNSIKDLRDIKIEKKMLRMAFIILAKRQGPKWCQKNIIKNMLMPLIENDDVPLRIKQFCVELLGPLLKPYPIDMKVHCEIAVNQLLDLLNPSTPDSMKEAIFTSLIYMNKHNPIRVTQSLLSWAPKRVSTDFEELMRDFIHEKPFNGWKFILSRAQL